MGQAICCVVFTMKKFKITIDKNACIGCGSCMEICPEVLALDSEGKATVIAKTGDLNTKALDAARSCPVSAIIITETNT